MADAAITQIQNNSKTYKSVEQEIKNTTNNINVSLASMDMSGAIDSFNKLRDVSQAADFSAFIKKILSLQEVFVNFQKSVSVTNTSITNFSKSADKLGGSQTAVITQVEVNTGDISGQIGNITTDVSANIGNMTANISDSFNSASNVFVSFQGAIEAIGQVFANITGTIQAFGQAFINVGTGIAIACDGVANLFNGVSALGTGLIDAATGIAMLIPLLPALGASMLQMAINMSGILVYLPELLIFIGVLLVLSLLGEGLMAAGTGLMNIGLGLTAMVAGMTALLEFMPLFIASLAGITENVGGIILFVLLAAAMLVMAIAMQMMNEQMTQFVTNMQTLAGLMSVGFVAAFAVFAIMLIAMSFFMEKVASGIEKITQAMTQQCAKLAILNPLMAAYAILSNPIMGAITVAAALVGGLLVKALLPGMATGGVVSAPTVAMVGEGRYPEAVVPLGDSPQFASMKADIANAVLQGLAALDGQRGQSGKTRSTEVVLNLDGNKLARAIIPAINQEQRRKGLNIAFKEV